MNHIKTYEIDNNQVEESITLHKKQVHILKKLNGLIIDRVTKTFTSRAKAKEYFISLAGKKSVAKKKEDKSKITLTMNDLFTEPLTTVKVVRDKYYTNKKMWRDYE